MRKTNDISTHVELALLVSGAQLTQSSYVPQAVIHGCESSTVLGVAELGQEHRGAELREGHAETEQDAADGEEGDAVRGALHRGAGDHDERADDDGRLPSIAVGDPRSGCDLSVAIRLVRSE